MSQVNIPRPAFQCWVQARSRRGSTLAVWRVGSYDCNEPPHPDFSLQPEFTPRSRRSSLHLWVWVPDLDGWERDRGVSLRPWKAREGP